MSQFNTRVLRVPGVPNGQIDEQAAGAFALPFEALGKAMEELGSVGQEIANKEQDLQDEKIAGEVLEQASIKHDETLALMAEADSDEAVEQAANDLTATYKELGARVENIGGDGTRLRTQQELSMLGGVTASRMKTRKREILVSGNRARLRDRLRKQTLKGIQSSSYEETRQRLRKEISEAQNVSFSEEEAMEEFRRQNRVLSYAEASLGLMEDENLDLKQFDDLTGDQYMALRSQQLSKKLARERKSESVFVENIPQAAEEAAMGVFEGSLQDTPSDALMGIMDKIDKLDRPKNEKQELRDMARQTYLLSGAQIKIEDAYASGDPEALRETAEKLRAQASEMRGGPNTMVSRDVQSLVKTANDRAMALEESERRKKIEAASDDVLKVRTAAFHLSQQEGMTEGLMYRELLNEMGGPDKFDPDRYPHGRTGFFSVHDQMMKELARLKSDKESGMTFNQAVNAIGTETGDTRQQAMEIVGYHLTGGDHTESHERGDYLQSVLMGEHGEKLQRTALNAFGQAVNGAKYPESFLKHYVSGVSQGEVAKRKERLEQLFHLHNTPAAQFRLAYIDEGDIAEDDRTLINSYFAQRNEGFDVDDAYRNAKDAAKQKGLKETIESFLDRTDPTEEMRVQMMYDVLSRMDVELDDGIQSLEKLEKTFLEQKAREFTESISGGGVEAADAIAKIHPEMDYFADLFYYYSLKGSIDSENPSASQDDLYNDAMRKAKQQAMGGISRTMFGRKDDGRLERVQNWSAEAEMGIQTANGEVDRTAIAMAVSRAMKEIRSDEGLMTRLEHENVQVGYIDTAAAMGEGFSRGNQEAGAELVRSNYAMLSSPKAMADILGSEASKEAFRVSSRSLYQHPKAKDLAIQYGNVDRAVLGAVAGNVVIRRDGYLGDGQTQLLNNFAEAHRLQFGSSPIPAMESRSAFVMDIVNDDGDVVHTVPLEYSVFDVMESRGYHNWMWERVGKTPAERIMEKADPVELKKGLDNFLTESFKRHFERGERLVDELSF